MLPCIVLGLETQIGLAVVRELGRAGVPVIGIAYEDDALALASRHLTRGIHVAAPRSAELIETIRAIGEEVGPCCLLTVSEANLMWLSEHRNAFGNVRPIVPPQAALEIALDKKRTLELARGVGIRVPQTVEPLSVAQVAEVAAAFPFPAVLKWKDPAAVVSRLSKLGIPFMKAEYIYSGSELRASCARYAKLEQWPLVQQYCSGQGLGQFFFMHGGEAVRSFQHVRLAEWPPEGGFSSVCESVPLSHHAELQRKSVALLQAMSWEGVAMVEYRFDPATGEAVLMEVNGRFWGSFPLAFYSGAGFALLAYALQGVQRSVTLPPLRPGVRCRMVATELKRLVRIVFQSHKIADRSFNVNKAAELSRFVTDFFRPGVRYYVWSWSDPGPFIADCRNLLRKVFGRFVSRAH